MIITFKLFCRQYEKIAGRGGGSVKKKRQNRTELAKLLYNGHILLFSLLNAVGYFCHNENSVEKSRNIMGFEQKSKTIISCSVFGTLLRCGF